MDEYTADAWHDVLGDLALADARAAAAAVAREQRYIAPCDILARAAHLRRIVAGRQRRAELDREQPLIAIAARPGADTRLTRQEINRIFADVTGRIGRPPVRKPPAATSQADIEAERQRQLAALDVLIGQDDVTEADIYEAGGGDTMHEPDPQP